MLGASLRPLYRSASTGEQSMLLGVWSLVRVRARRGCLTLGVAVISVVCCAAQPGPDTVLALSRGVSIRLPPAGINPLRYVTLR